MKSVFALAALAVVAACDRDDTRLVQTEVLWMDWPADVVATQPFRTHIVIRWGCGADGFKPGVSTDQSAVTFRPYYLSHNAAVCPLTDLPVDLDVLGALDTAGIAPGLGADFTRAYDVRASASASVAVLGRASDAPPIRTFGTINVQASDIALTTRRNAAGRAWAVRDTTGCLRLQPNGVFPSQPRLPIENPDDTTQFLARFVRGYIYDAPTATCGETRVFHLVAEN